MEIAKLFTPGASIFFIGERLPYKVMAVSKRYAVVSRKLNKQEDADLLKHEVKMGAYSSFNDAYKHCKNSPVYSLLDFQENVKAPDNLILGIYDYFDLSDCQEAIRQLEAGTMALSSRRCELLVDYQRVNN